MLAQGFGLPGVEHRRRGFLHRAAQRGDERGGETGDVKERRVLVPGAEEIRGGVGFQRLAVDHLEGRPDLRVLDLHEPPRREAAGAQVGEAAAEAGRVAVAFDDALDAPRAHVAAEVFVRLGGGGLGAGDEDETPPPAVCRVQLEDRVRRGAGAGEEVEDQVVRRRHQTDQILENRNVLWKIENAFPKNALNIQRCRAPILVKDARKRFTAHIDEIALSAWDCVFVRAEVDARWLFGESFLRPLFLPAPTGRRFLARLAGDWMEDVVARTAFSAVVWTMKIVCEVESAIVRVVVVLVLLSRIGRRERAIPLHHRRADGVVIAPKLTAQLFVVRQNLIETAFPPTPDRVCGDEEFFAASERDNVFVRHREELRVTLFPLLPNQRGDKVCSSECSLH